MSKIYFAKTKENAIIPTKRKEDAGYDIYACFEEPYIIIRPHETRIIPTGIASVCNENYCFILKERGSTGTKGVAQRSGVIDSGYRGEWLVPVTNTTERAIIIHKKNYDPHSLISDCIAYPYEKAICQALVIAVPDLESEEISYEELKKMKSERGSGLLGSSGK